MQPFWMVPDGRIPFNPSYEMSGPHSKMVHHKWNQASMDTRMAPNRMHQPIMRSFCTDGGQSSGSGKPPGTGGRKEEFEIFFGPENTFSQMHPANFWIDGEWFTCMEQYMQWKKAVTFNDFKTAKQIMQTTDPKQHKKLGRQVKPFNQQIWGRMCVGVVRSGNIEKYTQNPEMKKVLLATYPKTLVEASPRDRLWGIGLGKDNPKARDRKQWRGKNLLGQTLTEVRDIIMEREGLLPLQNFSSSVASDEPTPPKPKESPNNSRRKIEPQSYSKSSLNQQVDTKHTIKSPSKDRHHGKHPRSSDRSHYHEKHSSDDSYKELMKQDRKTDHRHEKSESHHSRQPHTDSKHKDKSSDHQNSPHRSSKSKKREERGSEEGTESKDKFESASDEDKSDDHYNSLHRKSKSDKREEKDAEKMNKPEEVRDKSASKKTKDSPVKSERKRKRDQEGHIDSEKQNANSLKDSYLDEESTPVKRWKTEEGSTPFSETKEKKIKVRAAPIDYSEQINKDSCTGSAEAKAAVKPRKEMPGETKAESKNPKQNNPESISSIEEEQSSEENKESMKEGKCLSTDPKWQVEKAEKRNSDEAVDKKGSQMVETLERDQNSTAEEGGKELGNALVMEVDKMNPIQEKPNEEICDRDCKELEKKTDKNSDEADEENKPDASKMVE